MAKKKKIDIKQVIADALEHYHKMKPSIKDSTKRQNESLLSEFYRFVDTLPARDRTMKIFSQKGLNRYKEYLIDKMERSKTDGKKRNFGVGQLNRCGSMIARLINKVLKPDEVVPNDVVWIKLEDPRREDQKGHIPLLDDEVVAIENSSGLSDVEEEYRDIFLLQIESGQRVSDLANILTGEYTVGQVDGYECIILETKKEGVPAAVELTPKVRILLERIKTHKHVDPKEFKKKADGKGNNTYNKAIRRITKKAGLDRIIVKIDTNKIVEKKPLYKVITNHDARSTFITNKIRAGMTPDEIAVFTGHVNGEMIRRVYAQPTIEDKLRNVKQHLSGGKNEKEARSSTDTSSNNSNESADVFSNESSVELSEATSSNNEALDSIPTHHFDRNSYIKGLEDIVEKSLSQADSWYNGIDFSEIDQIIEEFKQAESSFKEEIGDFFPETKEEATHYGLKILGSLYTESTPDYFKPFGAFIQLSVLRILIDNAKRKQARKEVIQTLEEFLDNLYEEYPLLKYGDIPFSAFRIMALTYAISLPIIEAIRYALYNNPIALFDESDGHFRLRHIINWKLVYGELCKCSPSRIENLIRNTNCTHDLQIRLYKSIVSGDMGLFTKTINSCNSSDVYEIIEHAYMVYYINMLLDTIQLVTRGMDFEEAYEATIEVCLSKNPFQDLYYDIDSLMTLHNSDFFLSYIHVNFGLIKKLKKRAYPKEKRVYDRLLQLIYKYPELKDAYDEYISRQNTSSSAEDVEIKIVSEENKIENRKKASSRVNYLPVSIQNLDIDKFIRLLTEKDELNKFQPFITVLESTDNVNVATCLKHFFGTPSNTPLSFTLKWNGNSMVSLKFLIRLIANTNEDAARDNVIKVTSKKSSDGISKNVSTWKGSGDLWTPVYNVFEGCTSSIYSAALGDEGTEARAINLNELETIADIYFACKK